MQLPLWGPMTSLARVQVCIGVIMHTPPEVPPFFVDVIFFSGHPPHQSKLSLISLTRSAAFCSLTAAMSFLRALCIFHFLPPFFIPERAERQLLKLHIPHSQGDKELK